jgi:hypothetical protein
MGTYGLICGLSQTGQVACGRHACRPGLWHGSIRTGWPELGSKERNPAWWASASCRRLRVWDVGAVAGTTFRPWRQAHDAAGARDGSCCAASWRCLGLTGRVSRAGNSSNHVARATLKLYRVRADTDIGAVDHRTFTVNEGSGSMPTGSQVQAGGVMVPSGAPGQHAGVRVVASPAG